MLQFNLPSYILVFDNINSISAINLIKSREISDRASSRDSLSEDKCRVRFQFVISFGYAKPSRDRQNKQTNNNHDGKILTDRKY